MTQTATIHGPITVHDKSHPSTAAAPLVVLDIDAAEIEEHGGFGQHVATICVKRADGKEARFFIRLDCNCEMTRGACRAYLTTPHSTNDSRVRRSGRWVDYSLKAEAMSA